MSELDARLFELESVLLEAQDKAANARDSQEPGPCRDKLTRLTGVIDGALIAVGKLQTEPWSL